VKKQQVGSGSVKTAVVSSACKKHIVCLSSSDDSDEEMLSARARQNQHPREDPKSPGASRSKRTYSDDDDAESPLIMPQKTRKNVHEIKAAKGALNLEVKSEKEGANKQMVNQKSSVGPKNIQSEQQGRPSSGMPINAPNVPMQRGQQGSTQPGGARDATPSTSIALQHTRDEGAAVLGLGQNHEASNIISSLIQPGSSVKSTDSKNIESRKHAHGQSIVDDAINGQPSTQDQKCAKGGQKEELSGPKKSANKKAMTTKQSADSDDDSDCEPLSARRAQVMPAPVKKAVSGTQSMHSGAKNADEAKPSVRKVEKTEPAARKFDEAKQAARKVEETNSKKTFVSADIKPIRDSQSEEPLRNEFKILPDDCLPTPRERKRKSGLAKIRVKGHGFVA